MNLSHQLLVTLLLLHCHLSLPSSELPTACFGLTGAHLVYHLTPASCLSFQEFGKFGFRAVLGQDKEVTFETFVRAAGRTGSMNRTQAEVWFASKAKVNDSNQAVGFDLNNRTLMRGTNQASSVSLFKETVRRENGLTTYAMIKCKAMLSHGDLELDLQRQKVAISLIYSDGNDVANQTSQPLLLFGTGATKPTPFTDKFVSALVTSMIVVVLLITMSTIVATITSVNSEKGKASDSKGKVKQKEAA